MTSDTSSTNATTSNNKILLENNSTSLHMQFLHRAHWVIYIYVTHPHVSPLASHRMLRVTRHLATQLQMQNAPVNVHLNNTNKSQPVSARAHACAFSIQPTRIPADRPLPQRPHQAREPRLCSHNSIIPANKVTRLRRGLSLLHRR